MTFAPRFFQRFSSLILVLCHAEKLGLSRLWGTVSAAAKGKSPLPLAGEGGERSEPGEGVPARYPRPLFP